MSVLIHIINFYIKDKFEKDRLILQCDIILDVTISGWGFEPKNKNDIVSFLCHLTDGILIIISEFFRLIRILLTIPVFNATWKRSYSALKRLKTFIRNSFSAKRLDNMAIMHTQKCWYRPRTSQWYIYIGKSNHCSHQYIRLVEK